MLKKSNNKQSKSRMLVTMVAAIVLISGLSVLSTPLEKAIANPCSGISSNGGDGGNGGPGGSGLFTGGPGGDGGDGGPGGTNTVECTFEDVVISEPLGP